MEKVHMSNLEQHAINEFRAAGWIDAAGKYTDEMQEAICKHVLALIKLFADEGHSGSTAPYTVNVFEKLAKFEPLVPLTGEEWEWVDVADYGNRGHQLWQNKRCGRVFKDLNGAYDIDGKVFWEWSEYEGEKFKSYYTSRESRVPVTFPYTPTTEYVERVSQ